MAPAVDVVIIGGGLIGCATAWHLARHGASVAVVERGDIGSGASGQNAGSLHFQMERRFLENGEAMADQAAQVIALNRLAIAEWQGLEAALGTDLEIVRQGGLVVAETAEHMALLEAKARREAAWALPTRLIDGAEARRIAPYLSENVVGASYMAEEGHANPRIIARAFATAARGQGARILCETEIARIDRTGDGFALHPADPRREVVRGRRLLLAAGAWTAPLGAMLNLHLPVFPAGLTMSVTEKTGTFMPQLIQHVGRRLSMKQATSGNILIGGGWASRLAQAPGGAFDLSRPATLIEDNLRANLRAATDTVPAVAELNLLRSWTGIVALTADQLPLAGAVSRMPGLYVVAGGSGFTLGPLLARLLALDITGRLPADEAAALRLFSPDRFDHLNSFMG